MEFHQIEIFFAQQRKQLPERRDSLQNWRKILASYLSDKD
jgi:hypothetical protein